MPQKSLSSKDFEIVKQLGSGSFGNVQLVRKKIDGKLYAIKSVNMVRLTEKERQSALNQVRLLASIDVPYVIGFHGSFYNNDNKSLCLVMEFADGGDLQSKIHQRIRNHNGESFEQNFIWKVAFEILQGLKILHSHKIVHRDIKSANVFFVEGIAKLGDLNVSKVLQNQFCSTQTGTPYYTSPQIWKGKQYGRKCDIWSTGCLLYEMCTLSPPFKAKDFPGLFRKVIVGNYDPIPSKYSSELSELIRMCLTVDENLRPEASQLLDTTILSGMQLSLEKFRQEQSNIQLMDPIKCPRVLCFLNNKLPQSKFQNKAKKTVGFSTKKQIQLEKTKSEAELPPHKGLKRAKSEKVIPMEKNQDLDNHQPLQFRSKSKVKLPPLKQQQQILKFTHKKTRSVAPSKTSLHNSKKTLRINEKQNSFKQVTD